MTVAGWLRALAARLGGRADLGRRGERAAARFLRKRGLRILERNVRARRGEIDIVAAEGETLVFVEVKSRTCRPAEERTGLERLDARKRGALRRSTALYRKARARGAVRYRLDAVTVEFEDVGGRKRLREVRWHPAIVDLDADGP